MPINKADFALSDKKQGNEVRPLTDQVLVEDAEPVTYNIVFTYYTQTGTG